MCPSFIWGTTSVHYLLGLPLAYALRSATPNGLMLLVKLTYSPVCFGPTHAPFNQQKGLRRTCCIRVPKQGGEKVVPKGGAIPWRTLGTCKNWNGEIWCRAFGTNSSLPPQKLVQIPRSWHKNKRRQ